MPPTTKKKKIIAKRREVKTTKENKGHLYAATFDATSISVRTSLTYAKKLLAFYRQSKDWRKQLNVVRDLNRILDCNWNDQRGARWDYECSHFNGELLVSDRISSGCNHNLQTSAGLELENLTKAGIGGNLISWVGVATGATEPTRGTTELVDEVDRIPTNPDGWLTASSDLLFTGVICSTNLDTGLYKSFGGYTGNSADDILGWVCLLPVADYVQHNQGSTIMIVSHVEESISLQ